LSWSLENKLWQSQTITCKITVDRNKKVTNMFTHTLPRNLDVIFLEMAELKAFRLVDMEGLSQEEAGQQTGVSRRIIWRLVQSARKKTAQALSEGRPIFIATQDKNGQNGNQKEYGLQRC
jgi:predicted DNA-binding protein (UPF0251 family)